MAQDLACAVCGQSVTDPALLSDCGDCGMAFHLNPRADVEGIDCGDVWTGGPEAPALQFYCRPCIDRTQDAAREQDAAITAVDAPSTPPGMPPLPPGAPPGMLAAMAGWATPDEPPPDAPPSVPPRPRRRRRFRRVDTD